VYIEGWHWIDALYMTIITLATIGYGETHPLSMQGRVFTIFLIAGGMGLILYIASEFAQFVVEGGIVGILRRRKMERKVKQLTHHYILCGLGRYGRYILDELRRTRREVVVVEHDRDKVTELITQGICAIAGDAAHDDTLLEAGITQASGLVSALSEDKDNLFVVITARGLNPTIRIVARVNDVTTAEKFRRSGADAVVSAPFIGGLRMASELIRPETTNFLDTMLRDHSDLRVDQVAISSQSPFCGQPISACLPLQERNVLLVALKRKNSPEYLFHPPLTMPIIPGDVFILLGSADEQKLLRKQLEV